MRDVEGFIRRRREATLQQYRYNRGYYEPRDITPGASDSSRASPLRKRKPSALDELWDDPMPGLAGQTLSDSRFPFSAVAVEGIHTASDRVDKPSSCPATETANTTMSEAQSLSPGVQAEVSADVSGLDEAPRASLVTETTEPSFSNAQPLRSEAQSATSTTIMADSELADAQLPFAGARSAWPKMGTMGTGFFEIQSSPTFVPPATSTTESTGHYLYGAQARFYEALPASTSTQIDDESASDAVLSSSEKPPVRPTTEVSTTQAPAPEAPAETTSFAQQDRLRSSSAVSRNDYEPISQQRPKTIQPDQTSTPRDPARPRPPEDSACYTDETSAQPDILNKRTSRLSFHRLSQVFNFGEGDGVVTPAAENDDLDGMPACETSPSTFTKRASRLSTKRLSGIFTHWQASNVVPSDARGNMADEDAVLEDRAQSTAHTQPSPGEDNGVAHPSEAVSSEQDTNMPPPRVPKPSRLRSFRRSVADISSSLKQMAGKKRSREEDEDEQVEDLGLSFKVPRLSPQLPALDFSMRKTTTHDPSRRVAARDGPSNAIPSTLRSPTALAGQRCTSLMGIVNTSLREQQAARQNDPVWRPKSPVPSLAPARHDSADWTREEKREFGVYMKAAEDEGWMMDLD